MHATNPAPKRTANRRDDPARDQCPAQRPQSPARVPTAAAADPPAGAVAAPAPNAPLAKDGDLAVFLKSTVTKKDQDNNPLYEVPIYTVARGPKGARSYERVWGEVSGRVLQADMVLELAKGEAIELEFPSRDGQSTYVASLVAGDLQPKEHNGFRYEQRELVKVRHLCRSSDVLCVGYCVPDGRGGHVDFYRVHYLKPEGQTDGPSARMDAGHCYRLLKGGPGAEIDLGPGVVRFEGTEPREKDGRTYTQARLQLRYHPAVETELEANRAGRRQASPQEGNQDGQKEGEKQRLEDPPLGVRR